MNGLMIILIVCSVVFVAFGLQLLSRQIQRFPVDVRRPDPLIDVTSTKSVTVRPAELHQLIGIISDSLISDASARSELQPILNELGATGSSVGGQRAGRGRNKRWQRIDRSLAELEQIWGLDDQSTDDPSDQAT